MRQPRTRPWPLGQSYNPSNSMSSHCTSSPLRAIKSEVIGMLSQEKSTLDFRVSPLSHLLPTLFSGALARDGVEP